MMALLHERSARLTAKTAVSRPGQQGASLPAEATAFPALRLRARPRRGAALLWFNLAPAAKAFVHHPVYSLGGSI
jgi:hypothetical protein